MPLIKRPKKKGSKGGTRVPAKVGPRAGAPRVLNQDQQVECWGLWVSGVDEYTLAIKYGTTDRVISESLLDYAKQRGYPDKTIDIELERLKLLDATDIARVELAGRLEESNRVLRETATSMAAILADKSLHEVDADSLILYTHLAKIRRGELLAMARISQELRGYNETVVNLTGVRKVLPKRRVKQVGEERLREKLETLSDAQLENIVKKGAADADIIDIQPISDPIDAENTPE